MVARSNQPWTGERKKEREIMGDRANVYVHNGDAPGVYLYTHWSGTELPETVRAALARAAEGGRLSDEFYLTRIIFSEMIKDAVMDTTGYGISAYVGDGDDRITDVDTANQTVMAPATERVPIADYIGARKPATVKRTTTTTTEASATVVRVRRGRS